MKKMRMSSPYITDQNIAKIGALFPNVLTETHDENGYLKQAINFELLKQELSDVIVEGDKERYQLTWPGKKEAVLNANLPISETLRPVKEDSVDWDHTQNVYIEGDNLEVMKLLQESYLNKVKCIYIDPPYNTGKDFIYGDKFFTSKVAYTETSGQSDNDGNKMIKNTETNGRFHSDWLKMMYSRLKIAKNLLTEDGILFISIDESEYSRLRIICDEILGNQNHLADLVWQNKKGGGNDSKYIAVEHEYIIAYAKNRNLINEFYETYSEEYLKRYKEVDKDGLYYWDTFKRKSGKQYYPIFCPDGTKLEFDEYGNKISWLRSEERFKKDIKNGDVRIIKISDGWSVQFKQRLPQGKTPRSIYKIESILEQNGTTSEGSNDLFKLFGKDVFSNPKPVNLINHLLGFSIGSEDTVLDFFSGSSTTAEAILSLNSRDNGNRKFILIQYPEVINKSNKDLEINKKTIHENAISILEEMGSPLVLTSLGKERIRRAASKIKQETNADIDYGFRVYKVGSSNMKDVYYKPDQLGQLDLLDLQSNIKEDRSAEDLLIQVMLELGLELSLPMNTRNIDGFAVYDVDHDRLSACFEENITESVLKQIATTKPEYAVFRDHSFQDDSTRINAHELFKLLSPNTDVRVL